MTIASRELFELCKQVYEATGWKGLGRRYINEPLEKDDWIPIYTSDYLLEKLPPVVQDPHDKIFRHIQMWINGDRSAHAGYVEPYAHDDRVAYAQKSDEMRITLLKLTIKLHEEGLL